MLRFFQMFYLMSDTINQRQNAHGQRHFSTLFQIMTLVIFHTKAGFAEFFLLFFQLVIQLMTVFLSFVLTIEQP